MAFIEMDFASGGTTQETLWTNPNPTTAFNTLDVILPKPYTDYDMIGIQWKAVYNDTGENLDKAWSFCLTSEFTKAISSNVANNFNTMCSPISRYTSSVSTVRDFVPTDATHINFRVASGVQTSLSARNNSCIPQKIIGIKGITID